MWVYTLCVCAIRQGLSNVASAVKLFGELRAECVRQFPTLDMLQCGLLADGLAEGGDWSAGNVDAAAAPVGAAAAVPPDAPNAAFINMGVLVGRQSNQVHTHLAPSSASPFSSPSFSSSASAASSNSSSSLAQSIAAPWARVAVGISPFASAGDAVANGTDSLYTSASAIGSAVSASSFPSSAHDSQQSNQIGRGNSSVAASPGLSPSASSSWFASAAERDAAAWSKYFAHLDAGLFWAYAHSTQWRRRRVKLRVRAGVPFAHRRAAYWVMLRAAAAVECQTPALYASLSGEQTAATMVVMPSSDNTRGTTRSGAEHGSIGSGPASVIAVDDSLSSAASLFATRVDRAFSASRLGRHFRGLFVPRPALLRLVRAVCAYDSKLLGAGMVAPDMNDGGTVRDRDRDSAQSAGDDFVLGQVTVLAAHLLLLMVEEEAFFVVLALLRGRFGLARLIAEARAALYPYPSPPLSHVFASSSSSSASDASISAVPSHADSVFAAIAQRLVCLRLPALHAHLDLHCPALVARYTLRVAPSLLADALPPDCALRVWDVLFFDGHKTLLRWVLALLAAAAADLRSIAPLRVPRETPAVIEASMLACLAEHAERLQTHPVRVHSHVYLFIVCADPAHGPLFGHCVSHNLCRSVCLFLRLARAQDALIDAIVSVPLTGAELAAIEVECLGQGNGRVDAQPDLMASVRNRRYFV